MKKTMVVIFASIFTFMCFSAIAESSSTVSTTDQPPLLNIYGTPYAADGQATNQNTDNTSPPVSSGSASSGYNYSVPQTELPAQGQPGFSAPGSSIPGASPAPSSRPALSSPPTPPRPPAPGLPSAPPIPGAPQPGPFAGLPGGTVPAAAGGYGYNAAYNIDITPEKVQQVLSTAYRTHKYLKPGKLWVLRGPGGELEIKGGIVYHGAVVSVIEFNPSNGSVLPAEYRPIAYQENVSLETIGKQFATIVKNLKLVEGAWYREPEGCWVVPLVHEGVIVSYLKIYCDGVHVVPDYEASREMAFYGYEMQGR